jgi:hypothetical protein
MKQSEDYTIFAWKCEGLRSPNRGLFAQSPAEFGNRLYANDKMPTSLQSISWYKTPGLQLHNPATLTSRGLLITLPLLSKDSLEIEVSEPCKIVKFYSIRFISSHFWGLFSRLELEPGTYLALICRVGSERDTCLSVSLLCVWLRKHPESGIFTRNLPGTVILLSAKHIRDFKMHTKYALPSKTLGDELLHVQ